MQRRIVMLAAMAAIIALMAVPSTAWAADGSASAGTPWWALLTILGLGVSTMLSEILALVPKWQSNSVLQWVKNILQSAFGAPPKR